MMNIKNKIYTVRTKETGDRVYIIRDGKRYWATSPEALEQEGFVLGQENTIKYSELIKFREGNPVSVKNNINSSIGKVDKTAKKKVIKRKVKPILGYKEEATLEDFNKFNA